MGLVKDNIKNLIPYIPGKPIEELERELGIKGSIKLASNENPIGPSPKAVQALHEAINNAHRYPDGNAYYLKNELNKKFNIPINEIILGNGSNELLELVVRTFAFPDDEAVISAQSFIIYKLASIIQGLKIKEVPLKKYTIDLEAMAKEITDKTKFIFLPNPNNPTGTYVNKEQFESFIKKVPQNVIIVIDEAYFEYADAPDYPDSLDYRKQHKYIITMRTFSKIYGLAGLRVGYAFTDPELVEYMNRVRAPFNVNLLAQKAAIAALYDDEYIQKVKQLCIQEKKWLKTNFEQLGIEFIPSQANFILIGLGNRDGKDIFNKLLKEGVIIRPMSEYGFPHHHRITVGIHEENLRMIEAYKKVI